MFRLCCHPGTRLQTEADRHRGASARTTHTQRKTAGSFLPRVLLESFQTIEIRSYAERER
jgi:hypothetical protein